jgi:uncharacterized protein (TIGR02646 family)
VIGIAKPDEPPDVLTSVATLERVTALCERWLQFTEDFRAGRRRFSFDARIYNHPTVKAALIQAQHGKCCFCESKIEDEGDVEHFRPKSGYRQTTRDRLVRPGYYWLVYDWQNLLLACSSCNQRFKRNHFPLADPERRAQTHVNDVTQEEPLLLNPAEQNPEEHIAFRGETPYAIAGSPAGAMTIQISGLQRRKSLNERRRVHLKRLLVLWDLVEMKDNYQSDPIMARLIQRAKDELIEAVGDAAEFASMTRCATRDKFRYARSVFMKGQSAGRIDYPG